VTDDREHVGVIHWGRLGKEGHESRLIDGPEPISEQEVAHGRKRTAHLRHRDTGPASARPIPRTILDRVLGRERTLAPTWRAIGPDRRLIDVPASSLDPFAAAFRQFALDRFAVPWAATHVVLDYLDGGPSRRVWNRGRLVAASFARAFDDGVAPGSGPPGKIVPWRQGRSNPRPRCPRRSRSRTLETVSKTKYVPPYAIALVHAGLEHRGAALAWLERAYDARDIHMIYLPVDPKWDAYRADPRFEALIVRCGFRPTANPAASQ
jgi:hypothetical protein